MRGYMLLKGVLIHGITKGDVRGCMLLRGKLHVGTWYLKWGIVLWDGVLCVLNSEKVCYCSSHDGFERPSGLASPSGLESLPEALMHSDLHRVDVALALLTNRLQ